MHYDYWQVVDPNESNKNNNESRIAFVTDHLGWRMQPRQHQSRLELIIHSSGKIGGHIA